MTYSTVVPGNTDTATHGRILSLLGLATINLEDRIHPSGVQDAVTFVVGKKP